MALTAARRMHWRSIVVAAAFFVGTALLFALHVTTLPQTMIAASRAALLFGLLGLHAAVLGAGADADDEDRRGAEDGR